MRSAVRHAEGITIASWHRFFARTFSHKSLILIPVAKRTTKDGYVVQESASRIVTQPISSGERSAKPTLAVNMDPRDRTQLRMTSRSTRSATGNATVSAISGEPGEAASLPWLWVVREVGNEPWAALETRSLCSFPGTVGTTWPANRNECHTSGAQSGQITSCPWDDWCGVCCWRYRCTRLHFRSLSGGRSSNPKSCWEVLDPRKFGACVGGIVSRLREHSLCFLAISCCTAGNDYSLCGA